MRSVCVVCVASVLLAGCLGGSDRLGADSPPGSVFTPPPAPFTWQNASAPNVTWYGLDAADVVQDGTLHRYLIRAGPSGALLDLAHDGRLGWYDHKSGCIAAGLRLDTREGVGALMIQWFFENSYRTGATAGPLSVQEDPFGRLTAIGSEIDGVSSLRLAPGEQALLEFGTSDGSYLREGENADETGAPRPNAMTFNLTAQGPVLILAVPTTRLACGVDAGQADAQGRVKAPLLPEATIDAETRLEATGNATLYARSTRSGTVQYAVDYGNETYTIPEIGRAEQAGVDMAIRWERSINYSPTMFWLMAETYWPALDTTREP